MIELSSLVKEASRVKVLGSGHSFNTSADPEGGLMVCLDAMEGSAPAIDATKGLVRVGAGVTYSQLADSLRGGPWALHNMASLPHISIGGAIATATHGSGVGLGCLASAVRALSLVTADGSVREFVGGSARFASVHLGSLGVVTHVTLALVPALNFRQDVYERLAWDLALDDFDLTLSAATSVSLFTTWATPLCFDLAWHKNAETRDTPTAAPNEWLGATLADAQRHPCGVDVDPAPCTEQLGVYGSWADRLPHFRSSFTPSIGDELQSEYFVARSDAPASLRALAPFAEEISKIIFVTEIRSILRDDDAPISMHSGRESVAIHFTWRPLGTQVAAVLPKIEAALMPFDARPHWGKLFTMDAEALARVYPRMSEFVALRRELDPGGKFVNAFVKNAGII